MTAENHRYDKHAAYRPGIQTGALECAGRDSCRAFGRKTLAGTVVPAVLRIVNPTLAAEEIMSEGLWVYVVAGSLALFTDIYASRKPAKIGR